MNTFLLLLASSTAKATVVLALALVITWLLRRRSAAARHLVWTVALASSIAVLALSSVLPAWRVIPVPAAIAAADPAATLMPPAPSVQRNVLPLTKELPSPRGAIALSPVESTPHSSAPTWPARILLIWALGLVAVIGRDFAGRITLHRLGRSSTSDVEVERAVQQLARQMGIGRRVGVGCSDQVELPLTWGVVRPQILLPADAGDWTAACRRHVLQHELAHVGRADATTQLVGQVAVALFWFHPLVRLAAARMRTERERACDDLVLASGVVASDYAADLLAFVTHHGFLDAGTVALGLAERSRFEQRLRALVDPAVTRGALSTRPVAMMLALSAAVVVPLAAMQRAVGAAPSPMVPTTVRVVAHFSALPTRPAQPPMAARMVLTATRPSAASDEASDAFAACARRVTAQHSDGSMDGDSSSRWTATGEGDDCRYALASGGIIQLSRDATTIEQISAGGIFAASTNIHGQITSLVIRASATGDLSYDFTRNGQYIDYSAGGALWLRRFLLCVDRTTAFAIDHRFPLLLNASGPSAALSEIERMHSDFATSMYLQRLIRSTTLDASGVARVGGLVAAMSAQHMAGEVILAVATRQQLTDQARQGFVLLANGIKEANIRSRALAALTQAR